MIHLFMNNIYNKISFHQTEWHYLYYQNTRYYIYIYRHNYKKLDQSLFSIRLFRFQWKKKITYVTHVSINHRWKFRYGVAISRKTSAMFKIGSEIANNFCTTGTVRRLRRHRKLYFALIFNQPLSPPTNYKTRFNSVLIPWLQEKWYIVLFQWMCKLIPYFVK